MNNIRFSTKNAFDLLNSAHDQKLFENQPNKWLTTKEAAHHLRLTHKVLLNMTSNGQVPVHKLGRRNRYLLSELDELLFAQKKGA